MTKWQMQHHPTRKDKFLTELHGISVSLGGITLSHIAEACDVGTHLDNKLDTDTYR